MDKQLKFDWDNQADVLDTAVTAAKQFLDGLGDRPAAIFSEPMEVDKLPETGLGAEGALAAFQAKYDSGLSGSPGPRYFGFVTGGATPASLVGDWLASVVDQSVSADNDSSAPQVEMAAIAMLRELFGLPETFVGSFVSGATMSNFVGLAQARQWVSQQHGVDPTVDGLYGLPPIRILTATPHSSIYKSLAMLGMGRKQVTLIPILPDREAMDVSQLARHLRQNPDGPVIVIASSGTVNTVDFEDLQAIGALKEEFNFWLHVDASFGGFAACLPETAHLMAGLEHADSVTIDAHKWLNVPYDSAMQFSRHPELQWAVFQNSAVYLGGTEGTPSLVHWTPQNSRRFRALPAWMTLMAYGRSGYQDIVSRNVAQTKWLGERIATSEQFELLAPVRLNVACFTLNGRPAMDTINAYLDRLQADGRVFMTPTLYKGVPAIRAAISNWQTTQADMEICWQAMRDVYETFRAEP
jgi:glutamate/tyrosine decarboxylase-like PLP-dependent enzyme